MRDEDKLYLRYYLSQICLFIGLLGLKWEGLMFTTLGDILLIFVALTLVYPPLAGIIPRKYFPIFTTIMISVVILDFAINWRNLLEPLLRMVFWVIGYRTVFYRTSRESQQVILLALFLIMFTGVVSISISYALELLIFTPLAMLHLFTVTVLKPKNIQILSNSIWKRFRSFQFIKSCLGNLDWRTSGLFLTLYVSLVLITAVTFMALPRMQVRNIFPSLQFPGTAKSGFSENFELGDVNSIILDDSVAFRVNVENRDALPAIPYWRMLVMDHYEDGAFTHLNRYANRINNPTLFTAWHHMMPISIPRVTRENESDWTYYMEGSVSRYLPVAGNFRTLELNALHSLTVDNVLGTLKIRTTPSKLLTYKTYRSIAAPPFNNRAFDAIIRELDFQHLLPEDSSKIDQLNYPQSTLSLVLSEEDLNYLNELVGEIKSQQTLSSPAAFSEAILRYLSDHHDYSLNTGNSSRSSSRDPVVSWLRSKSDGHCEYFAASYLLLARAGGLPCRVVTGFAGGDWSGGSTTFTVRNRHAHAWCEYFHPEFGWQAIDPTPPDRLSWLEKEFADADFALQSRWLGFFDNIKVLYYQSVINFDADSQFDFFQGTGTQSSTLFRKLQKWFAGGEEEDNSTITTGKNNPKIMLGVIAILVTAGLILAIWSTMRYIGNSTNRKDATHKVRNRARKLLRQPRKGVTLPENLNDALLKISYDRESRWPEPNQVFKEISNFK